MAKMSMEEALKLVLENIQKMTPEELRAELDKHRDSSFVQTMRELREFTASPEYAAIMEQLAEEMQVSRQLASECAVYLKAPTPYVRWDAAVLVRYADGRTRTLQASTNQGARNLAWRLAVDHNLAPLHTQDHVVVEWGTR